MKHLIVNADDYGFSVEINQGIVHCFENGIVTNASMIVNEMASKDAARLAQKHGLPVGLHLNLFSGEFADAGDLFGPHGLLRQVLYEREELGKINERLSPDVLAAVSYEFERQTELFYGMVGVLPNHVSYHFGLHFIPEVLDVFIAFAQKARIVFRFKRVNELTSPLSEKSKCPHRWYDLFHGGHLVLRDLEQLLEDLPDGINEISAHPGFVSQQLEDSYNQERLNELEILCSPKARAAVERHHITLSNYAVCGSYV